MLGLLAGMNVAAQAQPSTLLLAACLLAASLTAMALEVARPSAVVVLGGCGDLAVSKLMPALLALGEERDLRVMGASRARLSSDQYRAMLAASPKLARTDRTRLEAFLRRVRFQSLDSYSSELGLRALLRRADTHNCTTLVYLALPPHQFQGAIAALGRAGTQPLRVALEKPVGRDSLSCGLLLAQLTALEPRVTSFLVDHYLGKAAVQGLLAARRDPSMPVDATLSAAYVSHVEVDFRETNLVAGRGGYFEDFGIVRDVLQNHLLQLAALLMMDLPLSPGAGAVSAAKVAFLRTLRSSAADLVLGQYEGYRSEAGVSPSSSTSTYAACLLRAGGRWAGVPLLMRAGKALGSSGTHATAHLREDAHSPLCRWGGDRCLSLTVRVQPDPAIVARWANGSETSLVTYPCARDAYEEVLGSVLRGERALVVAAEEAVEAWRVFEPLLQTERVLPYSRGSNGPSAYAELAARHGVRWSD